MLKKRLIAAGILTTSTSTFAASTPAITMPTTPWYAGIGITTVPIVTDKTYVIGQFMNIHSRSLGLHLFGGYHVNKYFATELGFNVAKPIKWNTVNPNNVVEQTNRWMLHFTANAYLPVCRWFSPFVFAGVAYINSKFRINDGASVSTYESASGLGLTYGAGLQVNIKQFGIRLRYARYDTSDTHPHTLNLGAVTIGAPLVSDTLSLDALYRFGM